jgi:hypothetical protein
MALHVENTAKESTIQSVRELLPEIERQALLTLDAIKGSNLWTGPD